MSLTEKQQIFVAEYVKTGNATLSAQAAGYSKKTAYSQGARLLKNPEIDREVKKFRAEVIKNATVGFEETISELNQVLALAMTAIKPSAAVAAIMAKAKLAGLLDKDRESDENITPFEVIIRK